MITAKEKRSKKSINFHASSSVADPNELDAFPSGTLNFRVLLKSLKPQPPISVNGYSYRLYLLQL